MANTHGIECTLNRLEIDTKLGRDIGAPLRETVTGWNCMRFKKD